MPSTSKKPVKKAPNKSKSSFWSKLVPRTPKSQLLVFLLAFAVIGGGYMAYRSFAATGSGVYLAHQMTGENGAWTTKETRGAKKDFTVWYLPPNRNAKPQTYIAPAYWPVVWAPYVRGCANVRTNGPSVGGQSVSINVSDGITNFSNSFNLRNSSDTYVKYCTGSMRHTDPNARVYVSVTCDCGNSGNTVYVSNLSIEYNN